MVKIPKAALSGFAVYTRSWGALIGRLHLVQSPAVCVWGSRQMDWNRRPAPRLARGVQAGLARLRVNSMIKIHMKMSMEMSKKHKYINNINK